MVTANHRFALRRNYSGNRQNFSKIQKLKIVKNLQITKWSYTVKIFRAIPSKAESITSASSSTVILLGTDFLGTSGDSSPQGSKIKHKIFQTKKNLRLILIFAIRNHASSAASQVDIIFIGIDIGLPYSSLKVLILRDMTV